MVKEKKIKSVDEGFVAVLKLVEVLRDIVALKLNKYKLVDWYKINNYFYFIECKYVLLYCFIYYLLQ